MGWLFREYGDPKVKTYVIAPDYRTAEYYRQAFGIPAGPHVAALDGSPFSSHRLSGIIEAEVYVVNSDNGFISKDMLEHVALLERMHPETVRVEWIGFESEVLA